MATIGNIVNRALEKAGIKDPSQDAEDEDISTAIDELNDMMLEWHQDGIWAKYTQASVATDTDTTYMWMRGAMKSMLAIRLCAEYKRPVPEALVGTARRQWAKIRSHFDTDTSMGYGDAMPRGSGSYLGFGGRFVGENYYVEGVEDDLTVSGGAATDGRGRPLQDGSTFNIDGDKN